MRRKTGFTLIELMLVVAIIGLLAAIAVPKFANLVVKAKEASVRGKLGGVRSAISIYYADNEGAYPAVSGNARLSALEGKYLDQVPALTIPTVHSHATGSDINTGLPGGLFNDFGMWLNGPSAYNYMGGGVSGHIVVDCTHTDSKGTTWSQY